MDRYIVIAREGVTCNGSFCPIYSLFMSAAECGDCPLIKLWNDLEAIRYDGVC